MRPHRALYRAISVDMSQAARACTAVMSFWVARTVRVDLVPLVDRVDLRFPLGHRSVATVRLGVRS